MNVELTDLTRRFGRTRAVAGVSLQAGPGVFGLLGPNGAGKTSLLRMMATVIPPTSGTLRLLGRDPGAYGPRREIRRRLGYLPQNLGYYPGFTVADFVEYFALLKDMPPGQVPRAVAAAIEQVGLGDRARAKLRTLSGGMLRRAGIAQAIVNQPELLLLDEPTAGLDPEQRVAFRALLRDLGQRATVIVSTHLVEDVGAACSEVALMDPGKIVFHGTPGELTARGEGNGAAGTPRWSAATARCSRRRGRPRRCGHDRRDRSPGAAPAAARARRGHADGGPAAPDGAAPQRDAVDPAADRRAVLVRLLPVRHGHAAAWVLRTFWNMGQGHALIDFAPFVAGVAAWMGSRDGRRGTADLVTATARPRWAAQLATWAATAIWAVGAYLVFVGVMFAVYALPGPAGRAAVVVGGGRRRGRGGVQRRGVRGRRLLPQPVHRAAGRVRRASSRWSMSSQTGFGDTSGWALILPTISNGNYEPDSGIFYPYLPDLPIARMMFLAGIAVAALGLLGPARPGRRRVAAAGGRSGHAGRGGGGRDRGRAGPDRPAGPHGMVIPALHDAANDRPIALHPGLRVPPPGSRCA